MQCKLFARPFLIFTVTMASLLIFQGQSRAEWGLARGVGMGGAISALARGAEAPAYNPANLAYRLPHSWSFSVLGVGGFIANNSFSIEHYNRYNGKFLTEKDKEEILSHLKNHTLLFDSKGHAQALSLAYKNFAFSLSWLAGARGDIAKEIFELGLMGNELDRQYDFNPISGQVLSARVMSLSAALPLKMPFENIDTFAFGLSLSYISGLSYGNVNESIAQSLTGLTSTQARGSMIVQSARGGHGYGFNLGMAMAIDQSWYLSVCMENMISTVTWNRDPELTISRFELVDNRFSDLFTENKNIDSVFVSSDTTYSIAPFTYDLPSVLRLGAAYEINNATLAFEIVQGFKESAWSERQMRFSLGAEYKPFSWLDLRSGFLRQEHIWAMSYGTGFYLGSLRWDLALKSFGHVLPGQGTGLGAAMGFQFLF